MDNLRKTAALMPETLRCRANCRKKMFKGGRVLGWNNKDINDQCFAGEDRGNGLSHLTTRSLNEKDHSIGIYNVY